MFFISFTFNYSFKNSPGVSFNSTIMKIGSLNSLEDLKNLEEIIKNKIINDPSCKNYFINSLSIINILPLNLIN